MKRITTKTMTALAMLVAMEIVLNRFLSINAWNLKIGFAFVPVVVAAVMFGPVAAGAVGALGDFIGAILFPIGAYFPGFTLTAFLMGAVFGIFLRNGQSMKRIVCAVAVNQLLLSFIVNSAWISLLYGSPFVPLLATRILQCAVLIPVQILLIRAIAKPAAGFRSQLTA